MLTLSETSSRTGSVLGKSTGKGALGIWTHHLDSIEPLINYSSRAYTGAALRMGAGVLTGAIYAAAHRHGFRVVGGTCPTVGIAGSFSLGGGYSMLTRLHGLGTNNVLEWEVVLANGTHTRATPHNQHRHLYWALSGGGGGTYAVVVSMTARMHRDDATTAGAVLTFSAANAPSPDAFWAAIDAAQAHIAPIVDTGALYMTRTNRSVANITMAFVTITAPGQSERAVRTLLQPVVAYLEATRIAHNLTTMAHDSFYVHFDRMYGPLPNGQWPASALSSSHLIPGAIIATAAWRQVLTRVYRAIATHLGWHVINIGFRMLSPRSGSSAPVADNAVHPAWSSAQSLTLLWGPWDYNAPDVMAERQALLTNVFDAALAALTPGSAPYLNEANYAMPNVLAATYGPHSDKLRRIKARYDPDNLFYVFAGVGSEVWSPDQDGRLCRTH